MTTKANSELATTKGALQKERPGGNFAWPFVILNWFYFVTVRVNVVECATPDGPVPVRVMGYVPELFRLNQMIRHRRRCRSRRRTPERQPEGLAGAICGCPAELRKEAEAQASR